LYELNLPSYSPLDQSPIIRSLLEGDYLHFYEINFFSNSQDGGVGLVVSAHAFHSDDPNLNHADYWSDLGIVMITITVKIQTN